MGCMNDLHPNDREGSRVINQLLDGVLKLGFKRGKKHHRSSPVILLVVAVILEELRSDLDLDRLQGETSVLFHNVCHAVGFNRIGNISDGVESAIGEFAPHCILENNKIIGPIELLGETFLAVVVPFFGRIMVPALARGRRSGRGASFLGIGPCRVWFTTGKGNKLVGIDLDVVSHDRFVGPEHRRQKGDRLAYRLAHDGWLRQRGVRRSRWWRGA